MDFSGRIVLCYIEEDNTQRAYFRIRPLLTADGPVSQADVDSLPDEGYLRIVPDKNEQHTFKERMRSMGCLCVLDLTTIPAESIKVRTNKNYAPSRGELNQYIVYSDVVQAVPPHLLREVIAAEPGDKAQIAASITPLCYLRSGGRIYGPVSRATALEQEGAAALAPDSKGIYGVVLPNGTEKLFYWVPETTGHPAPHVPVAEVSAPPQRLAGMPLYQTVARRTPPTPRAHNPLMDRVDQLRAGLEAPGAQISAGTPVRAVENPMDDFKRSLGAIWPLPDMQRQAVAYFLGMTGVRSILNHQLGGSEGNAITAAVNSQIQDLEAERLALLMQSEALKKDISRLHQEAASQLTEEQKEVLRRLKNEEASVRTDLETVSAQRETLLSQRDEILQEIRTADRDAQILSACSGGHAERGILVERVIQCMNAQGLACSADAAQSLLVALCLCHGRMEIVSPAAADAVAAAEALALALGAPYLHRENAQKPLRVAAGGDSFCFAITPAPLPDTQGCITLIARAAKDAAREEKDFARAPWPVVRLMAQRTWTFPAAPALPPVGAESVRRAVLAGAAALDMTALRVLDHIDSTLVQAGAPLPQRLRRALYQHIACLAPVLQGSIAKAIDLSVCTWVLPYAKAQLVSAEVLRPALGGLTSAQSQL